MSSFSSTDGQSKSNYAGMSERRSIDYIPESERHGHPFSQFTLWFGGNLQITAIVTGALAVVLGGDVVWSLVGLLVGQMLGAAVMSLHALQGPRLGLPQMILSRPSLGFLARWCRWCWFASCISVFLPAAPYWPGRQWPNY